MKLAPTMVFVFALLCASATQASQNTHLQMLVSTGVAFESYEIYETKVKSVSVFIDYEILPTDCHGLDYRYDVKTVTEKKYLISKDVLLKPMSMCNTQQVHWQQSGIKIEIPVIKNFSITVAQAEFIVPLGSHVVIRIER